MFSGPGQYYFARLIYSVYSKEEKSLLSITQGHYLLSMVENVMSVEPELLSQAQTEDLSSQKLLWVVSNVTLIVPNFQHHTNK